MKDLQQPASPKALARYRLTLSALKVSGSPLLIVAPSDPVPWVKAANDAGASSVVVLTLDVSAGRNLAALNCREISGTAAKAKLPNDFTPSKALLALDPDVSDPSAELRAAQRIVGDDGMVVVAFRGQWNPPKESLWCYWSDGFRIWCFGKPTEPPVIRPARRRGIPEPEPIPEAPAAAPVRRRTPPPA